MLHQVFLPAKEVPVKEVVQVQEEVRWQAPAKVEVQLNPVLKVQT